MCKLLPGIKDVLLQLPVSTIQSGPVNSLRGAAALTGIADGIVIDIGMPCIIFIHLHTNKMYRHRTHATLLITSNCPSLTAAVCCVQACGCKELVVR